MPTQVYKLIFATMWFCSCEICIYEYMLQCEWDAWRSRHIANFMYVLEMSRSIISGQERKKHENINEVFLNGSRWYEIENHVEKSIYCRNINSSPDSLPNWNIVLVCCGHLRQIKIPQEESTK